MSRFFMYYHKDIERDIPNTFDPECANKFFTVVEVIYCISKGYVKREDVPADVLKRVDAEIKFVRETQVEKTKPLL